MKTKLIIKLVLVICCICLFIRIHYINEQIDNSIKERYTALYKLRGDPSLDTAENRIRYLQKKEELNNQIESLKKKKFPLWWNSFYSSLILIILGWQLRFIYTSLFKKELD